MNQIPLSVEEQIELEHWMELHPSNRELQDTVTDIKKLTEDFMPFYQLAEEKKEHVTNSLDNIPNNVIALHSSRKLKRSTWLAAASFIVLIATVAYFYISSSTPNKEQLSDNPLAVKGDVLPATQQATLTLGNYATIQLNDALVGEVAREGAISIKITKDGALRYEQSGTVAHAEWHTLTTPKGGFFHLTLEDGTRVWLNAASNLEFPTAFTGGIRKVLLRGEAYFEVATKAGQPFLVETDKGTVQVLGTHFNIKTYEGEPMTTTLLEGSVKVMKGSDKYTVKTISPGQQALIEETSETIQIDAADGASATAWMQGVFAFRKADLRQVMREISRWYNIAVDYQPGVQSSAVFMGEFDRNITLSRLLPQLEQLSNLSFEIQGRNIYVSRFR